MDTPTKLLALLCMAAASTCADARQAPSTPGVPLPGPGAEIQADPNLPGTLAIRAVQGTKGGPEVGAEEVGIVLYHRNQPVHQLTSHLDEHGVLLVQDLPVGIGVRPVVRVKHAGVLYQEVGPPMDAGTREAAMDVTVYEVTDEQPAWRVVMRHVASERIGDGLGVSENVVVENPGDRTWLGAPPDAQDRRATVVLDLPPGASEVSLQAGFHGWCCTALDHGRLVIQMPLMPGKASYRFAYHVPALQGRAELRVGAAAPIDSAVFMVADEGAGVEPVGTSPVSAGPGASPGVRMFQATSIQPGASAGVVLTGLVTQADLTETREANSYSRLVVAIGIGLLILGGIALLLRRRALAARGAAF